MLKAKPLFTLVTVAIASAAPGLAQEKFWRTVQVPAGATARLGSFSNLKPDCSPGPLPEIKVVTPAKTGVIAVRRRQGKLGPATRCPNADATAQIVSYQAKPTPGQDEVAFQVTLPNGKVVLHTVVISVTEAPGPAGATTMTSLKRPVRAASRLQAPLPPNGEVSPDHPPRAKGHLT
jgi:hypothetical protein